MKGRSASALCFFLAGAALASALSHNTFDMNLSRYEGLYGKSFTIDATVTDVVWDGGHTAIYIAKVKTVGELSGFLCTLHGEGGVSENSTIRATVTFSPITSTPTFDSERYYFSKGVICEAQAESITVTGNAPFSLSYFAKKVNKSLCSIFSKHFDHPEDAFASALILGNKDHLPETVTRDFTRLGLSHILAISGMHLTVMCTFVTRILSPFGKRAGQIGSVLTVVFYMFITGLSPSVTRSGIMLLFVIASSFFKRSGDSFTNLGISVFLICIIDPYSCGDIGLHLSFAAVFVIILYSNGQRDQPKKLKSKLFPPLAALVSSLIEGAVLTVIIVLFLLPLEWCYFGQISLISPLTSPFSPFFAQCSYGCCRFC